MKIADVMHKSVFHVTKDAPLKVVAQMIFSLGISGIPVIEGQKLVGIITEQDILANMYPSMQDIVEDYAHARSFESMEKNLLDLLDTPVESIMNRNVTTVSPKTPLMEAQSIMLLHEFSRLPVVNEKGELIGIISQGDIFRQLIKNQIPRLQNERYANFVAGYYDLMVDWNKRFGYEFPALFQLFDLENVKSVLDIGSWTGTYTLGLVKGGLEKVVGLDHTQIMIDLAEQKRKKFPQALKKRVAFMLTDYKKFPKKLYGAFDAVICMGNALPYIEAHLETLLKEISRFLRTDNSVFIVQLLNTQKILKNRGGLLGFTTQKSKEDVPKEHLFIEFLDQKGEDELWHNLVVFASDGTNWLHKGFTRVSIKKITKDEIESLLKKVGFKTIISSGSKGEFQGSYGKLSFSEPFNPLEDDWLTIVAKR